MLTEMTNKTVVISSFFHFKLFVFLFWRTSLSNYNFPHTFSMTDSDGLFRGFIQNCGPIATDSWLWGQPGVQPRWLDRGLEPFNFGNFFKHGKLFLNYYFFQSTTRKITLCSLAFTIYFWFQVRLSFETFASDAALALARLEELQDTLSQRDLPRDLEGARRLMEEHAALKKRATKASVEELDTQGRRLLQRLQAQTGGGSVNESGYINRLGGASGDPNDHHHGCHTHADAHNLIAKVSGLLDKLHGTRQNLQQLWHMRKLKLDQCFQLRLFEQDAEKVWAPICYLHLYVRIEIMLEVETIHNNSTATIPLFIFRSPPVYIVYFSYFQS